MTKREEALESCLEFANVYQDSPFHDDNWILIRHKGNKKTFACIYEREGNIWINVKFNSREWSPWRSAYEAVIPAYHMNKEHWNSIILNGTIPEAIIITMLEESYELTKPKQRITRKVKKATNNR